MKASIVRRYESKLGDSDCKGSISATRRTPSSKPSPAAITHSTATGWFPEGVFASESPVAPRTGAHGEADGYVVTFVSDMRNDGSECQIFEAADITRGPIARVRLPHRISSGTHATWVSEADLAKHGVR